MFENKLVNLFVLVLIVFVLMACLSEGINHNLCDRGYPDAAYVEMQLDCSKY